MSYILDALKKVELEKVRNSRPDGKVNLTGDLLRERSVPRSARNIWKFITWLLVSVVIVAGCVWGLFFRNKSVQMTKNPTLQAAQQVVAVPPHTSPVIPLQPAPMPQPVPAPVPASSPVLHIATDGAPEEDEAVARRVNRQNKKIATVTVQQLRQQFQTVQAPADIKLSGIAWQDDRAVRRAVINGYLLKEGAVVSGAKITEILPDKVKFSTAGGVFELKLDAVFPSTEQKR